MDTHVLAFALMMSLLAGTLVGIPPVLQVTAADPDRFLRQSGRSLTANRRQHGINGFLVGSQLALAFLLLVGAGLLVRSFARLLSVNPGIRSGGVLTAEVALPWSKYPTGPRPRNFYQQLLEKTAALPGVTALGAVLSLPLSGSVMQWSFKIEGRAPFPAGQQPDLEFNVVTPGYFQTVGVPLRKGRIFTDQDGAEGQRVAVINQTMAHRFFSSEDPIGKRITVDGTFTVIGVVGDVHYFGLATAPGPQLYVPHQQYPWFAMRLVLRSSLEPNTLVGAVRSTVQSIDPNVAVSNIATMDQVFSESLTRVRFSLLLLSLLAAMALALATVGIYSVMSYSVSQRTHEMGIRLALGANRSEIVLMVVRQGMRIALTGIVIGLAAALVLTRVMESLLYDVKPSDPTTFAAVAFTLTATALLACWAPALKAALVDPNIALRYQ
jgi:putative ABC transport system permease protein